MITTSDLIRSLKTVLHFLFLVSQLNVLIQFLYIIVEISFCKFYFFIRELLKQTRALF